MTSHIPYTPPGFNVDAFNCPFCSAFAKQNWGSPPKVAGNTNYGSSDELKIARCYRCGRFSIWVDSVMVHPAAHTAAPPNADVSEDVKKDYEEARAILQRSPRGAEALLRLAIQKICKGLGEPGENINTDIASLVKKGLSPKVQKALDTVRVVGNNAVHPGQIDLRDNADVANQLFGLVNLIAEVMFSQPKQVEALYGSIVPESSRKAIDKRDASA